MTNREGMTQRGDCDLKRKRYREREGGKRRQGRESKSASNLQVGREREKGDGEVGEREGMKK